MTKYKFDPESLQFTEQDTKSKFLRTYIGVGVAGMLIAIALLFVSAYIIVPPSLRKMRRVNTQASSDLEDLSEKYAQMEKVLKDLEKRDSFRHCKMW